MFYWYFIAMTRRDYSKAFYKLNPETLSELLGQSFKNIKVGSFHVKDFHAGTNFSLRLEPKYSQGSGPGSVFVKSSGKPASRLALAALGALYTEAQLAQSKITLPFRHPRLYGGLCNKKRLLSLLAEEDISESGVCHTPLETLSLGEVRSGLDELAKLHASCWGLKEKENFIEPWRLQKPLGKLSAVNMIRSFNILKNTDNAPQPGKNLNPLRLSREFQESSLLYGEGAQTLLHGDPHVGNTYTTLEGRLGFLDLQLIRYGNWSSDIGYFLISSLLPEVRRQYLEELLHYYLERLESLSVDAPKFQEALHSIRYTPAFGLASWLHTLAFKIFQEKKYCLEMAERFFSAYEDFDTGNLFKKRFMK